MLLSDAQIPRTGRPAQDCHKALIRAAQELKIERAQSGQGSTLLELVHRSQVGYAVARALVPKLKSRGSLVMVGERRVARRNRPVYEYAAADAAGAVLAGQPGGVAALHAAVAGWGR